MNAQELQKFLEDRHPSWTLTAERIDVSKLVCYGCAHSASTTPFPSQPSGERPCVSCVRNTNRGKAIVKPEIIVGNDGHARLFDPWEGTMYNGAPHTHFPSDNYITMDSLSDQEFLNDHPEYKKSVFFDANGDLFVKE